MNEKMIYIWRLATFLQASGKVMSGQELARHLNRNGFLTSAGVEYRGKRGIYRLIGETCRWANETFESPEEARRISDAFVKSDGAHAVSASE